jgi:hypothetical protein
VDCLPALVSTSSAALRKDVRVKATGFDGVECDRMVLNPVSLFFLWLTAFVLFNKLRKGFDPCEGSYELRYFSLGPVNDTAISGSNVWLGGFMRDAGLPITLIVVGSAWLLWYYRLFPDIDWIIAAGLVLGGIAILFMDGITKNSVVTGPILIASGIAWALHDRWHVTWFVLLPTLLVLLGLLMLIARRDNIPERRVRQT